MRRPIAALRDIRSRIDGEVTRVRVATPEATVQPLIHERPRTGLEGKFSMPYAVATALLDDYPDFGSFTDAAVNRAEVQRLLCTVELDRTPGEGGLRAGEVDVTVELAGGQTMRTRLAQPPGAPARAPSPAEFDGKLA